jgi:hypothetical protein
MIQFNLHRYSSQKDDTLGVLRNVMFNYLAYTCEDERRTNKIKGETRIPAGSYRLGIRQEVTPLTQKYLDDKRLPFFERHIELLNVPNFVGVYIHLGNTDYDTDGCILVGDTPNNNTLENGRISNSVSAYKRFYELVYPMLKKGDQVIINIIDLD